MSGKGVIDTATVQKSTSRLRVSSRDETTRVASWMKHQAAASGKNVRIDFPDRERKTYDCIGSGCMHVGLNSRKTTGREILLSITVVAVVRFGREPAVKVIAVPNQHAARICCSPRDSLAVTVLGENRSEEHTSELQSHSDL